MRLQFNSIYPLDGDPDYWCLQAFLNGEKAGEIKVRFGEDSALIDDLEVFDTYVRMGIGRILVINAEEEIFNRGIKKIQGFIVAYCPKKIDKDKLCNFWESLGYHIEKDSRKNQLAYLGTIKKIGNQSMVIPVINCAENQ